MTIIEAARLLQQDDTKRFIRDDGHAILGQDSFGGLDLRCPDGSWLPLCSGDMTSDWTEFTK